MFALKVKWMVQLKGKPLVRQSAARWAKLAALLTLFLLLLTACQRSENATPTPFPTMPADISVGAGLSKLTPVPVTVADVLANPEFFEGAAVRLTGQYYKRPLLVCGIDPHPSPAEWTLVEGENVLPGAGFGQQMRRLWPDGLTFTVIGRLRHWQGPVGCGKQAVPTEMWYLDVVQLVAPSQLALVTLTPGGINEGPIVEDISEELFTPPSVTEAPEEGVVISTMPPVAPPPNTSTAVPIETLSTGFTPVATGTESRLEGTVISRTAVATASPFPDGTSRGTATLTLTPRPGTTATPTTPANGTPLVTGTPSDKTIKEMDDELDIWDVRAQTLLSNEIHAWPLPLFVGEEIVISVLGEPGVNIALALLNENLSQVVEKNETGPGGLETLTYTPPADGDFTLHILATNNQPGAYLLTTGDNLLLISQPQQFLNYGDINGNTIVSNEQHFWAFRGERNDVIDVTTQSQTGANLLVTLYDADGKYVSDAFGTKEILDFALPADGLYIIEVREWELAENQYQIMLTGQ